MKIKQCELAGSDNCIAPIGLRACAIHDDYCNRIEYTDAADAGQTEIKPFKEIARLRSVVIGLEKYNADLLTGGACLQNKVDTMEVKIMLSRRRILLLQDEVKKYKTEAENATITKGREEIRSRERVGF